ncbi:Ger(x)C family spore germination protein [Brevibacillus sp. SYSU BS000544]|uniref:Ger(x)C family spore germination protein n=1 Tax=Brevibacillus sp. SYSU BS000544 TaxID=3416443 RepID=UPI003CE599D2
MKISYILLMISCIISGCSSQRVVNKTQLVQTIGFDWNKDENTIRGTILYPTFEEKGLTKINLLDTISNSYYDILPRLSTKTTFPIEQGQLRMVVFSKSLAAKGIQPIVHSLCRDPKIGTRAQLGVAEQEASKILKQAKDANVPFQLFNMVNQNISNGNLPRMNLQVFLFNFYGEGRDPYLPYFIMEQNKIKINGLALFKKEKFVAHIGIRESFILKLLMENTKNANYQIKIPGSNRDLIDFILLSSIRSKVQYSVNVTQPIPSISINIKIQAKMKDVPTYVDLTKSSEIHKVEKMIEKYFEEETQKIISFCQRHQVDPIGFGDMVRGKTRDWGYRDFQKIYPQMKTDVEVLVKVVQTGVAE